MKILITGGTGFVGSYLFEELTSLGHQILSLDCHTCDIRNFSAVSHLITNFNPDAIYHLAALAHVPTCEESFEEAIAVNVTGTYNILKSAQLLAKAPRIIFISTANVYGIVGAADVPLTETSPVRPDNNYAITKFMAEELVLKYQRESQVPIVIFRSFNHIGPRQNPSFVLPNFVRQLVAIKNQQQEPILKVGNLSAERDFTDVRDIVKAYCLALTAGAGIYNLCSSKVISINDLLNRVINILDLKVEIEVDPTLYRKNDLPILMGDNQKVKTDLAWSPSIPLDQTLNDIINEFQAKPLQSILV